MNSTEQKPDTTYNGWKNRETWAFMLWLGNDEGLYAQTREYVSTYKGDFDEEVNDRTITDTAAQSFGEEIIDQLYEAVQSNRDSRGYQDGSASMAESALRDIGSTWRIDWREVAEHLNEWND